MKKYIMEVTLRIRPENYSGGAFELREEKSIEINSLSEAATILVKLHDLFETVSKK